MYKIYGRDRLYNYELMTIVQNIEEVQEIIDNDETYEQIMVIKRENNTDEIINIEKKEKPKIFRKKKW